MLESGLALIACCLPTLAALGRGTLLQSLVRSVRSLVSLRSTNDNDNGLPFKSRKTNGSHKPSKWDRDRSNGSITSQVAMVLDKPKDGTIETYVMGAVPKVLHEGGEDGSGVIWVDSTMEQRDHAV